MVFIPKGHAHVDVKWWGPILGPNVLEGEV